MTAIGFVGLGNMGLPMAKNLAAAGHDVSAFDVVDTAREAAKSAGIAIADGNTDAVEGAEIVVTMLPNGDIAKAVAAEILPAMKAGMLLIDCSTIDVASAREIHRMAGTADVLCLDAPVSGGVGGAEAGTLTFMVGGTDEAFTKGEPFFEIMGKKAVHCGGGGDGQAAKICNNMLLGISMIGACEAFNLADKLGLSKERLFDVISTSSGSCWSVNTYCPVPGVGPKSPADNDYKPGFAAALMLKDLSLAMQAAGEAKSPTPLGEHARALYHEMVEGGEGGSDFSAMIRHLAEGAART